MSQQIHFVVVTLGSAGDLFSFMAMALALRARGHRVSFLAPEQHGASREQTAGIEQVNTSIGAIDGMTQQNTLVEEASNAAAEMQQQAAALAALVSVFKLEAAAQRRPVQALPARALAYG